MAKSRSRRRKKVSHRQARSLLRTFRTADAAIVRHLTRCKTCSSIAARFLARQEMIAGLSQLERDFISHMPRWNFLSLFAGMPPAPQNDLSKIELHDFLASLRPDQTTSIQHLLECQRCRMGKALSPQDLRTASTSLASAIALETIQ